MVEYNEVFEIADDRASIVEGDRLVLIVEDDALFAQILLDLAHEKGFQGTGRRRVAMWRSLWRASTSQTP